MRKIITTIALAALSSLAIAGTQSANFQATATLNAACTLSMNDFNFGAILFNSDSSKLSQLKSHMQSRSHSNWDNQHWWQRLFQ